MDLFDLDMAARRQAQVRQRGSGGRLQASSADIDQTLGNAAKLSRGKTDFVIHSTHETASGMTEITVRYSPIVWIVVALVGFLIVACALR